MRLGLVALAGALVGQLAVADAAPRWGWRAGDVLGLAVHTRGHSKLRSEFSTTALREERWRVEAVTDGVATIEVEVIRDQRSVVSDQPPRGPLSSDRGRRYRLRVEDTGRVLSVAFLGPVADTEAMDTVRRSAGAWQNVLIELPPGGQLGWSRTYSMPSLLKTDLDVELAVRRTEGARFQVEAQGQGYLEPAGLSALFMTITHHQRVELLTFDQAIGLPTHSEQFLQLEGVLRIPRGAEDPPSAPALQFVPMAMHLHIESAWSRLEPARRGAEP